MAEHGEGVDVENLSQDRELIIDETGQTSRPTFSSGWVEPVTYTLGNVNSGYLSLRGRPWKPWENGTRRVPGLQARLRRHRRQECPSCGSNESMVGSTVKGGRSWSATQAAFLILMFYAMPLKYLAGAGNGHAVRFSSRRFVRGVRRPSGRWKHGTQKP